MLLYFLYFSDDLIEPPPYHNVVRTIMNLKKDQVIDEKENLTPIGYHLAALPLDVKPGNNTGNVSCWTRRVIFGI